MQENKLFLNVNDVCDYMSVSKPKAYKIIKQLNDELKSKGYLVVAGKISKSYFESKLFISHSTIMENQHASV